MTNYHLSPRGSKPVAAACILAAAMLWLPVLAQKRAFAPDDVPSFQLRARALPSAARAVEGRRFSYRFTVPGGSAASEGGAWSEWLAFGRPQIEATLKGYPATYIKGFPVVVKLQVGGVQDPTPLECEVKWDDSGQVTKLKAELFGPTLGILLWDEAGRIRAGTMADYNQRYWKVLQDINLPAAQRPKKFPLADRFIGGDDDRLNWRDGIENLSSAGYTALMLPGSAPIRDLSVKAGVRRGSWAVYSPPGYAFDHDPKVTPEAVQEWAEKIAKPYRDAGYEPKDMSLLAMSDEPGWYYPKVFRALTDNPEALARFHRYLKNKGLSREDLGARAWDEVMPIGRSQARDLSSKRLFYWTARFFSWDSARHFANSVRALEGAFYPGVPVFTNWNFFSGRFWVPGPVAKNDAPQDPDAAMGGHDWFEFARMRGGTMLWTEDWFLDNLSFQWSFYAAKLRPAAEESGLQFGGYVVLRTAGALSYGVEQKVLSILGHGGKAVKYYTFGPEYNFPGNCYSEQTALLRQVAETHRLIGAAEPLLWPGRKPRPEVAILAPRSAQPWDAAGIESPRQIQDATNVLQNRNTVDYMAEVADLYLGLQHANVPADFVDEDRLTAAGLKPYRVLYITEPNIPADGQGAIAEWVRAGGTLVTVPGASARDEYNEPSRVLSDATGIREQPRERQLVPTLDSLRPGATVSGGPEESRTARAAATAGPRSQASAAPDAVRATFDDGSPAVILRRVGSGRVIHFTWFPGLSYAKSAAWPKERLPSGFDAAVRNWIVYPVQTAKVISPVTVDLPLIEAPILLSDQGAAVTLLNWTGEQATVTVTIRTSMAVRTVESVKRGRLQFRKTADGVSVSLPLGGTDILMIRS